MSIDNLCEDFLNKNVISNNKWNKWTSKSENIPFSCKKSGIGDGEEKVASELDTITLGQNSNYDMKINIDGSEYHAEIKKLDKNTFNTGAKGRNLLTPIKNNISSLLEICKKINNSLILENDEKKTINQINEIIVDEISVSNVKLINEMCFILNKKQENILSSLPKIYEFERNNIPIEMTLDKYFKICQILDYSISEKYNEYKENVIFLNIISHQYISYPELFRKSLDELNIIFNNVKLIFVDKEKGYYICNNKDLIKFERITRGSPRFRVIFC